MGFKDFDLDGSPAPDPKLIGPEFILGGEKFTLVHDVPGVLIGDIMLSLVQRDGEWARDVARCITVLEQLLVERRWVANEDEEGGGHWEPADDLERWNRVLHSRSRVIRSQQVAEVFDWVLTEYAALNARPTQPSDR